MVLGAIDGDRDRDQNGNTRDVLKLYLGDQPCLILSILNKSLASDVMMFIPYGWLVVAFEDHARIGSKLAPQKNILFVLRYDENN